MAAIGVNDRRNLETLLRLAAAEADALRADLADMARARTSAARSLAAIDEERPAADSPQAERRLGRRRGLMMTLDVLARAEERAEAKLAAVRTETAKLETLLRAQAFAAAFAPPSAPTPAPIPVTETMRRSA